MRADRVGRAYGRDGDGLWRWTLGEGLLGWTLCVEGSLSWELWHPPWKWTLGRQSLSRVGHGDGRGYREQGEFQASGSLRRGDRPDRGVRVAGEGSDSL